MVQNLSKLPRFSLVRLLGGRPNREIVKRMTLAGLLAAALITAFYWGRHGGLGEARGQSPQISKLDASVLNQSTSDRSRYVVAYIFGNVPVTREELGEYLIERVGAERLEFLVNRKIIEKVCADKNIRITDAEVNAQFGEELKSFNCTEAQFVNTILKRYNKTLVEWKEDVIKPKLALRRYVQDTITIAEKDITKGFEAKFGPRVDCRIIALTPDHEKDKFDIWKRASQGQAEFEAEAKRVNPGPLAAEAGKVPPIHKHFPDPNIEEAAFKLKPGEISSLIALPDKTTVILHCVSHKPGDTTISYDKERTALHKDIFEQRVEQRVKEVFPEMRKAANPQLFLKPAMFAMDTPSMPQMPQAPAGPGIAAQPQSPMVVPASATQPSMPPVAPGVAPQPVAPGAMPPVSPGVVAPPPQMPLVVPGGATVPPITPPGSTTGKLPS